MDSRLEKLKEDLESAVEGMSSEQLNWHLPGKWCAAEVLEHLYLTYAGTIKGFEKVITSDKPLATRASMAHRVLTFVVENKSKEAIDTLRLVYDPKPGVTAASPSFRFEIRSAYRLGGSEAERPDSLDPREYILLSGFTKGLIAGNFASILAKLHGSCERAQGGHCLAQLRRRPWS